VSLATPEESATGLWTTPIDRARTLIAQYSYYGEDRFLLHALARDPHRMDPAPVVWGPTRRALARSAEPYTMERTIFNESQSDQGVGQLA
jgi:hypothetical protein